MTHEEELRHQVEEAIHVSRARYLITAVIDGNEFDAGEAMIGPGSDAVECCETIRKLAFAALHRQFVAIEDEDSVRLVIEDVPLLY